MTVKYSSSLKTMHNTLTGKTYYYVKVCGAWSRISKAAYDRRDDAKARQDCFLTIRNGHMVHNFKEIYGTQYIK